MEFAPKAVATIIRCQQVLAEYIVPDSGISEHECIKRLLGILDDQTLVKEIAEIRKEATS